MKIDTPLYFTKKGRGWKESSVSVTLKYEDGTDETTSVLKKRHLKRGDFTISGKPANGYYIDPDTDEKIRITNIAGYCDGQFLKHCPHCEEVKPVDAFDYIGRFTGGQRDQSNCGECRSSY